MTEHYVDCQARIREDLPVPRPTPATFDALVAGWLTGLRSANTRAAYAADLARFTGWCAQRDIDPIGFDARALRRYRTAVERSGASSATTARRLSAIASFGAYAAEQGATSGFADVVRPTVTPRPPEVLGDDDAAAMLRAADELTARAAVLVRLLMLDGLKVGEAAAADAADVTGRPPTMVLTVAARSVRLHPDTATALHGYLARRRTGPLLLSEGRARRSDRLSRFGIDYLVKEIARSAGVDRSVSGNTLRRRYVVTSAADGTALDDIRSRVGHADVRTTRRYLPRDAGGRK
jgi:site-specific recombinase XerD